MERDFSLMSQKQLQLIKFDYHTERIAKLKECSRLNQYFLNQIVQEHAAMFETDKLPNGQQIMRPVQVKPGDVYKMRATLKSFYREWSKEGFSEREQSFTPIIAEVEAYFREQGKPAYDPATGHRLSVLHPGCGMGRLVFEFAVRNFRSQGNEFAYFMLLASNFILNSSQRSDQFQLFPFIHNWSNLKRSEQAFQPISVPDVCPNEHLSATESDFSMVAGEFIEVYQN